MMNKIKICFSAAMLVLLVTANSTYAQSGQGNQSQRVCFVLQLLGMSAPAGCEEEVDASEPTFPVAPAADACPGHPGVRPRPGFSTMEFDEGRGVFVVTTPPTTFEPSSAEDNLPLNLCPTVYENARSMSGAEIPNTLPSTPDNPYNLHPEPTVSPIDPRSPSDDLRALIRAMRQALTEGEAPLDADIQFGIDILEGNEIDRAYSGMPLLHYNGPNKVKKVQPVFDDDGNKIGGVVELHQVWFDGRIMGDTALLDPSEVQDVPWTMIVHADTLNNGHEDFAPFQMYFDDPAEVGRPVPHVAMDMTFFPMEDGPRTLLEWETFVFGEDPEGSEDAKLAAIAMIGDLAPAKRMWNLLREFREAPELVDAADVDALEAAFFDWRDRLSLPSGIEFDDDYDVNVIYLNNTMYGKAKGLGNWEQTVAFDKPGDQVRVKVMNGDYFPHGYMFVDFGGNRGWENTFHSTVDVGGAGPWFTFGRAHWWPMLDGAAIVPPAMPAEGTTTRVKTVDALLDYALAGEQRVTSANVKGKQANYVLAPEWLDFTKSPTVLPEFQRVQNINGSTLGVLPLEFHMNHTPSKRLRMYQFDPLHHDVAVWSIH